MLYAHGGGFSVGGLLSCDHICRRLAVEAGVVVVSVEYRLAPEHPFPGPLQDGEDALDWLLQQDWDIDRLVVAGDSAGGNLAAALALSARPGHARRRAAARLPRSRHDGFRTRRPRLPRPRHQHRGVPALRELYLAGADPKQPYASPLHAPDLTGLPRRSCSSSRSTPCATRASCTPSGCARPACRRR